MSSSEKEPRAKKSEMDAASQDASSPILEHTDATSGVPAKKFSILTAMMDSVPDILVDNVLADLEFRDVFTFKGVSHRCEDIVLSNLKRLKKPMKTSIHVQWANNTKSLTIGYQKGAALYGRNNVFLVVPKKNMKPSGRREGSMYVTKKLGSLQYTEVRSDNDDDVEVVAFLLKKYLPLMMVNGICAKQLEESDFVRLSEILKTHAVTEDMHVSINEVSDMDRIMRFWRTTTLVRAGLASRWTVRRSLRFEHIMPILSNERIASIEIKNVHSDVAIPKSFFQSSSLKNVVKISLGSYLATEFDNHLLMSMMPQLKELRIGESNVTASGLNTFLKEYLAGVCSFIEIELKLRHPNESIEKDVLWTELAGGIAWSDYNKVFRSVNKEKGLGMRFLDDKCAHSVKFFSDKCHTFMRMVKDSHDESDDLVDV